MVLWLPMTGVDAGVLRGSTTTWPTIGDTASTAGIQSRSSSYRGRGLKDEEVLLGLSERGD